MNVPEFDPIYLEIRDKRPDRFRTWQEAEDYLHVERWPRYRDAWPMWTWPHLTDAMIDEELSLPFRILYAKLLDRSGLPVTARATCHYLARLTNGTGRRAWPPIDTIADRVGAGRTAVKEGLRVAEDAGWVLIVRHKRAPSDYLLDVPDYAKCPCQECRSPKVVADSVSTGKESRRSDSDPQQSDTNPLTVAFQPSDGQIPTTHWGKALGSSLDSEHQRSPSEEAEPWLVPPTKNKTQDYAEIGRRFAERIAQGQLSINDAMDSASGIQDDADRELFRASLLDAVQGRAA